MPKRLRSAGLVVIALLLVATVVACGGGDDDDDDAPAANGSADTEATQQASPTANPGDDDDDDGDGPDFGESGSGTFTIDGEQFEAEVVLRCEPFDAGAFGGQAASEDDFDFVAAVGGGAFVVQGEVAFEEVSSFNDPDQSYTAIFFRPFASRRGESGTEQFEGSAITDPQGDWYTSLIPQFVISGQPPDGELLEPPAGIEVDGNRVRGALTLAQTWPQGATGTVDVSFDLEIPGEAVDCSTRG